MFADSKREEALRLAEALLDDIELARVAPIDIARKSSRLARLLDDGEAATWCQLEIAGYPPQMDAAAEVAAMRSNREAGIATDGSRTWWTNHLAALEADARSFEAELEKGESATSSSEWAAVIEREKAQRRDALRQALAQRRELIARIVGGFHRYAAARYQELRFGAAIETAFEVVREQVDADVAMLVPDALPKLNAALENTTSSSPEDWASAAATCRRLLKAAADALRVPGPDKDGRKMGNDQYINRLIDWIEQQATSKTLAEMISADLEYLGRRLDAVLEAAAKGAHSEVDRFDASRFVTGTYLLLGDILRLRSS